MELEPGFKLSEAGPIPEDWEAVAIGPRGCWKKGRGITRAQVRAEGIPVVRYGELYTRFGDHIRSFASFVEPEAASSALRLQYGDICFAASGETAEEIGKCAAVLVRSECYAGGDIVVFSPTHDDPVFLGFLLNTPSVAEQKARRGQGDAVVHIHAPKLAELTIPTPSRVEQSLIAAALADVDVGIASAEAEVAKLASVKAAAMDALLTPTARLPGFSGQWCPVRIGDLYDALSTVAVARAAYVHGNGVACIHYGDIHVRYDGFVRIGHDDVAAVPAGLVRLAARLMSGDVMIADAAEDLEGVGKVVELIAPADFQVVGGLHVQALRPKAGKLALGFAGYLFRQATYRDAVERAASGLKVYGISKSQLSALEVLLPPTLEEQQAITAALSDIDTALAAARAVLAKARNVKAAAVDALLSGRVRLPGFGATARRASADELEAA